MVVVNPCRLLQRFGGRYLVSLARTSSFNGLISILIPPPFLLPFISSSSPFALLSHRLSFLFGTPFSSFVLLIPSVALPHPPFSSSLPSPRLFGESEGESEKMNEKESR